MPLNSIIGVPIATIGKTTSKLSTEIARMSSPSTTVAVNYFNDFSSSTVGQVPNNVDNPYNNPIVVDDGGNKVCRIVGAQSFSVNLNPVSNYVKLTAKLKYVSGDKFWVFGVRSGSNVVTTGSWGDSRNSMSLNYSTRVAESSSSINYDYSWHTYQLVFKNGLFTLYFDGRTELSYSNVGGFPSLDLVNIGSWGSSATFYVDEFKVETKES